MDDRRKNATGEPFHVAQHFQPQRVAHAGLLQRVPHGFRQHLLQYDRAVVAARQEGQATARGEQAVLAIAAEARGDGLDGNVLIHVDEVDQFQLVEGAHRTARALADVAGDRGIEQSQPSRCEQPFEPGGILVQEHLPAVAERTPIAPLGRGAPIEIAFDEACKQAHRFAQLLRGQIPGVAENAHAIAVAERTSRGFGKTNHVVECHRLHRRPPCRNPCRACRQSHNHRGPITRPGRKPLGWIEWRRRLSKDTQQA